MCESRVFLDSPPGGSSQHAPSDHTQFESTMPAVLLRHCLLYGMSENGSAKLPADFAGSDSTMDGAGDITGELSLKPSLEHYEHVSRLLVRARTDTRVSSGARPDELHYSHKCYWPG